MSQKFHTTKICGRVYNKHKIIGLAKKLTTTQKDNSESLDRRQIFMFDLQKLRSRESSGNRAFLHESAVFVTSAVMFVFYPTTVYV